MDGNNRRYGPLVAIFYPDTIPTAGPNEAVVMAVILSLDGTYEPLGIGHGENCLYVNVRGEDVTAWIRNQSFASCDDALVRPVTWFDPTPPLNGRAFQPPGASHPDDYPDVARWDMTPDGRLNGIGLKCQRVAWCDIWPHGTTRLTDNWASSAPNRDMAFDVVSSVKGWYDQQYLAVDPPVKDGTPGNVLGAFFPHPKLESWTKDSFALDGPDPWRVVAVQMMSVQVEKYQDRLNLDKTDMGHAGLVQANEYSLCHGSAAHCRVTDAPSRPACDDDWWARIRTPGNRVRFRCVDRTAHDPNLDIDGTVRFRWDNDDEKAWIRCGVGCCSVEP